MSSNAEDYEANNKKTVERFGKEKCLNAYDIASTFIPFKPGQEFKTWQEKVASELNVSEEDAMNLWIAGNEEIQSERLGENKGVIEKYGKEKCKAIYQEVTSIISTNKNWTEEISKKHSISNSEVREIFLAGANLMMGSSSAAMAEGIKSYHNNRHNLHSCPKKNCDGNLHETVSQSEEYNGLYICDGCQSTFKRKN